MSLWLRKIACFLALWVVICASHQHSQDDDWATSVFAGAKLSNLLLVRGGQSPSEEKNRVANNATNVLSALDLAVDDNMTGLDTSPVAVEAASVEADTGNNNNNNTTTTTARKRRRLFSSKRNVTLATAKRQFLDRISLVSSALLEREHDAALEEEDADIMDEGESGITHQSDLTIPGRHIHVVTTAALPWMTGTAVNPLLRAAYLVRYTNELNKQAAVGTNSTIVKPNMQWVTLVVPWLELEEDQEELYGNVFESEKEQENYIRTWLRDEAEMADAADPNTGLKIRFYPSRYHPGLKSIFAMGNILDLIPEDEADVCLLEEPEHLNFYRAPGDSWTKKFHYVVGIVHTNYKEYASAHYSGLWTAPAIQVISSAMVRAYCHKVLKLSDVLQTFAPYKEETSNVHGVRAEFLKEGRRRSQEARSLEAIGDVSRRSMSKNGVYFIGKTLWAKGLDIMLELEEYYRQCTGEYFEIDIYGSGPEHKEIMRAYHGRKNNSGNGNGKDESRSKTREGRASSSIHIMGTAIPMGGPSSEVDEEVLFDASVSADDAIDLDANSSVEALQSRARAKMQKLKRKIKATTESLEDFEFPRTLHEYRRQPIPATFPGRVDHALLKEDYKIFINPSITEVLCTTTAEALAMGKFAIIPVHPSNTFFLRFPNCLAYRDKLEFVANLRWALTHEPEPLTPEQAHEFTWEAATERFILASAITHKEARERERLGLSKLDERIAWFHNELGKGIKGDAIRRVLGAGPASQQVRYLAARQTEDTEGLSDEEDDENEEEDEDEGLPRKLRRSSFASAIRSTVANGLPSLLGTTSSAG